MTYDANGNVLTYGNMEFEWTNGRTLSQITVNPEDENGTADVYRYTYDESGIRSSKTVNGVTTYFTTKDGVIQSQTDEKTPPGTAGAGSSRIGVVSKEETCFCAKGRALVVVLSVFTADVRCVNVIDQFLEEEELSAVQLQIAIAVAAVPKRAEPFLAVRGLVVDEQHVFLLAVEFGDEDALLGGLSDVPVDFLVVLVEGELRGREFPELREVELVLFALIVEAAEELSRERDVVDDRTAAADVKGRVLEFLAGDVGGQVARGQPDPRRREVAAPVLVFVAVAGLGLDFVLPAVRLDPALVVALVTVGMPVHVIGFRGEEEGGSAPADVPGDLRVDLEIPLEVAAVAHPLGVGFCVCGVDMDRALHVVLIAVAVVCLDKEGGLLCDLDVLPAEEPVELHFVRMAPHAGLDHEVGRLFAFFLVRRQLAEDRLFAAAFRTAGEVFEEERFFGTGLFIDGGQRMPPPVVALFRELAGQHPSVFGFTVLVKMSH